MPGQGTQLFGTVLQTRQAGLQARVLAQERGFQACLGPACVAVHLRDQGVRGRGFHPLQQAQCAALAHARAKHAHWHRDNDGHRNRQRCTEEQAGEAAGQPGGHIRHATDRGRQPGILTWHARLTLADAVVKGLGTADLIGSGFDPHRHTVHTWLDEARIGIAGKNTLPTSASSTNTTSPKAS